VPVRDKCPSCDAGHVDLSKPAFAELADPDIGLLTGVTWTFVRTDGAGNPTTSAPTTSAPTTSAAIGTALPGSSPTTSRPGRSRHHRPHRPTPSAPTGAPTASPTTSAVSTGTRLSVLVTGYGWWDNTPPGSSEISNPVIHRSAGGAGTYADPITVAVPYHCGDADAAGCLQWPVGTRFYLPSLQRYLIVEDICGDGGPDTCGDSNGNHLDVWVGGKGLTHSGSDACESRITGKTTAILKPSAGLPVTPGDICR
jgi:hypothetical protein